MGILAIWESSKTTFLRFFASVPHADLRTWQEQRSVDVIPNKTVRRSEQLGLIAELCPLQKILTCHGCFDGDFGKRNCAQFKDVGATAPSLALLQRRRLRPPTWVSTSRYRESPLANPTAIR